MGTRRDLATASVIVAAQSNGVVLASQPGKGLCPTPSRSTTGRLRPAEPATLTVRDVLELEEVRVGRPSVVAGTDHLDLPVRWVHVAEVPDIAKLLRGGELVLTTGIAFPDKEAGLARYVEDLADAGASGLVLELVRRYAEVPRAMVGAAERCALPLVALEREVPFVAVTEAVHTTILSTQLAELRVEEKVHRAFHALTTQASPSEVVTQMSVFVRCPVVFENLAHRPLAVAAHAVPLEVLLSGWEERSRRLGDEHPGWLAAPVDVRGQPRGRVVLLLEQPPAHLDRAVLASGADALAVAALVEGAGLTLEQSARRKLLGDLVSGSCRSLTEFHVRARALGVDFRHKQLGVLCVRSDYPFCPEEALERALARTATAGICGRLHDDVLLVLAAVPRWDNEPPGARAGAARERFDAIASDVSGDHGAALSAGFGAAFLPAEPELEEIRRGIAEASEAAAATIGGSTCRVATVGDLDLRGVLRLLSDDARLQRFVERSLHSVWDHDQRHGTQLLNILRCFLESGGNKSLAALRSHLSRTAFYHSFDKLAVLLGCDLDDAEVRTGLHVALLATSTSEQKPGEGHGDDGRRGERPSAGALRLRELTRPAAGTARGSAPLARW